MKNRIAVFTFILFTFFYATELIAQWQQTNGPYGGNVYSLASINGKVIAGADYGIFYSTNNGTSWTKNTNISDYVHSIVVSGNKIFASINYDVYTSTDEGVSWTWHNDGGMINGEVHSIAVVGTSIFAGTQHHGEGIYLLAENSKLWVQVNNGLPAENNVNFLTASGTNLFAGIQYKGVYLSTNNGASWNAVNYGLEDNINVNCLTVSGKNLFIGTDGRGIYRSNDNGASWIKIDNNFNGSPTVYAIAVNGTDLYAGTPLGIFKSVDNGDNWTKSDQFNDMDKIPPTFISSFTISGTNIYAGTLGGGVYLSTNDGTSWTQVNDGLIDTEINTMLVSENKIYTGTERSGIFLTTNNGSSWMPTSSGLTDSYSIRSFAVKEPNIFIGTNYGFFRSTDRGVSWIKKNNGIYNSINTIVVSGTNIFLGTAGDGIYLSTNNGDEWTPVNNGLMHTGILSLAVSGTTLFAGTAGGGGVYSSANNGANWIQINNGFSQNVTEIYSLCVAGTDLFAGTNYGLYLSTNYGISWTKINNGDIHSIFISDKQIFVVKDGYGVFSSNDNGAHWVMVNQGLANPKTLAISGTDILLGTIGRGVWKRPVSQVTAPIMPTLLTPLNKTIGTPIDLTLNWNALPNALTYRLQISTDSTFAKIPFEWNITGTTSKKVFNLAYNTTYYWRVNASNDCGTGLYSAKFSFTTILAPPMQFLPMNGTSFDSTLTIRFIWKASSGATSYKLQISKDFNFLNNVMEYNSLSDTTKLVTGFIRNNNYYWRVNASNNTGTNSYSSTWMFKTVLLPPALVSPSNNSVVDSTKGFVFSWKEAYAAASYRLQISTNKDFTNVVFDRDGITYTLYQTTAYEVNGTYYWKVCVTDSSGISSFSEPFQFYVGTTSVEKIGLEVPTNYALYQNYPNPFNPNTIIRFSLPKATYISLMIYNNVGQEVAQLVSQFMNAGVYTTEWNASHYSSGIYYYRITAGEFVDTKKLLLLK
jgi:photosystem II stability/assembly factor-like uncharacterized protein